MIDTCRSQSLTWLLCENPNFLTFISILFVPSIYSIRYPASTPFEFSICSLTPPWVHLIPGSHCRPLGVFPDTPSFGCRRFRRV